jgi:hypothetical protein
MRGPHVSFVFATDGPEDQSRRSLLMRSNPSRSAEGWSGKYRLGQCEARFSGLIQMWHCSVPARGFEGWLVTGSTALGSVCRRCAVADDLFCIK